jgi:hypothetical protein
MGVSHCRPAVASKSPVKLMEIAEALDRAIVAHAKWKYRLMAAIDAGQSEWRVADVRADVACEFGTWLAALPLSERLSDRFKQVRSLHADFHVLASNVLELALSGRTAEATTAMALGSRFAVVSSSLVMAVTAWKDTLSDHAQ